MSLLHDFVEKKHCILSRSSGLARGYQNRMQPLLQTARSTTIPGKVIQNVEEFGFYIVLIPGVAMPHSQQARKASFKTAIGFMQVEKPVVFAEDDPDNTPIFFLRWHRLTTQLNILLT
jgi:PTS system ascorbate-specific IIA component